VTVHGSQHQSRNRKNGDSSHWSEFILEVHQIYIWIQQSIGMRHSEQFAHRAEAGLNRPIMRLVCRESWPLMNLEASCCQSVLLLYYTNVGHVQLCSCRLRKKQHDRLLTSATAPSRFFPAPQWPSITIFFFVDSYFRTNEIS
jgi:hypothetical protein